MDLQPCKPASDRLGRAGSGHIRILEARGDRCGYSYLEFDGGWRQGAANFSAGVANGVLLGQGERVLGALPMTQGRYDTSSFAYQGASFAGAVAVTAFAPANIVNVGGYSFGAGAAFTTASLTGTTADYVRGDISWEQAAFGAGLELAFAGGGAALGSVGSRAAKLCSFSAETGVRMADGSSKPISDVEVGDEVLAEDPETGERGSRVVTHLWVHEDTLVDLRVGDEVVSTTEDHPFWNVSDGEWQRSDALDEGDLLLSSDGGLLVVGGLVESSERGALAFNLSVDGVHTFFVSVGSDADVLVHNAQTCPIGGAPSTSHGLGVSDPPSRVHGPWLESDLQQGAVGVSPSSLGKPELHHADQMPGSAIHEVDAIAHRQPGVHPNVFNQGVTDAMRTSDRQLHWWYRSQEMGGWEVLGPQYYYSNWPW